MEIGWNILKYVRNWDPSTSLRSAQDDKECVHSAQDDKKVCVRSAQDDKKMCVHSAQDDKKHSCSVIPNACEESSL